MLCSWDVSIVDTRVVCLAGEYTADLLCRMAGRRIPDGAAPGSMPGCGTTIFLSFDYSFTPFGVTEPARKRRHPKGSTAG